ncbi:MAG TPA: ABC transporter permease, partial [Candidatus Sulfotelmatobacter sp.]|nr:ABC transporter permease [Candidatus Sulfotelmatobacter sp.]
EVVGTMQKIGHGNNNDQNMRLIMPYSTMSIYFPMQGAGNENAIKYVAYQPITRQQHAQARKAVRSIVARNHGFDPETPDAFDDWDTIATAEMVGKISDAMDTFLGAVGLVTLGLGAIGVINIMLVSVTERTREIGLRKALGATRRNILLQFFLEGLTLTGISGAIVWALPTQPPSYSNWRPRLMDSNCPISTQRRLCSPWAALPWLASSPGCIPRGGPRCFSPWKPFVRSNE